MFSTILERMIKIQVPDRNDPTKTVEINRYVIDKNEKPTAVIFGKFSPWSFFKGHGRLVEFAKKYFDNIVIVSPTRKGNDPKVDIFTDDQKQEIIERATGLKFIRVDSSIPIRMFTRVIQEGIDRPIFIVGPDRINDFKRYFVEYNKDNEGTEDQTDKDFGKGEYLYMDERGDENTSSTKVRKALLDNDKEEFINLTGYDESFWILMRNMLKKNGVIKEMSFNFHSFYYLCEGGNVLVKGEQAHKIPIDKISSQQYDEYKEEIVGALRSLNKQFEAKYQVLLFPNIEENIKTAKLFSGSTRTFFTKSFDEYKKYKNSIGDIDLNYPEENRSNLKEFLSSSEGKKFGTMTLLGMGGKSPIQFNTIFTSTVSPELAKNIQFDFEPTYFEDGSPNEFATFSHYSAWSDIQAKIKGAFSKLLMRALVGSKQKLGDIAVMTPTGKISKSGKYENPSMRKFSVDKGMRVAFEPVIDKQGKILKSEDGKPVYKELPTAESKYERNLENIFTFVFDTVPTPTEKQEFHSFVGLLQLMKKYLDKDTIKMIFSSFLKIIWENGQELEQGQDAWENGIQMNDFNVKKAAYDQFTKVFPYLKVNDEELKNQVRPFYDDLKRKKDGKFK